MIKSGLKGEATMVVAVGNTAIEVGSGSVPVFATPMLVAIMENAAINALKGNLEEGSTTVGVEISLKHLAATPIGMTVRAEAELTEVEGRQLTFRLEAFDDVEKVGEGTHRRFILDQEKFIKKSNIKSRKSR